MHARATRRPFALLCAPARAYLCVMLVRLSRLGTLLGVSIAIGAAMAACGGRVSSTGSTGSTQSTGTASTGTGTAGSGGSGAGGSGSGGGLFTSSSGTTGTGGQAMQGFDVQPSALQTIMVPIGQTMP